MIKHQEVHPRLDVTDCFGCRIASVRIGAAAMPTRKPDTNERTAWWDQQMRDDAAYKRLRLDGLHPRSTKDCALLENVDDRRFIEAEPLHWNERGEYLESTDELPQLKVET